MATAGQQIEKARGLLAERPPTPGEPLAALGAAFLAATAAVLMAGVMVLGPGFAIDEASYPAPSASPTVIAAR